MLWYVLKKIVLHVGDYFFKSFLELVEILLVKEYLMLVEGETSVGFLLALAFSDGEIVVVISLGRLDVKEIGPLAGPYRLGPNICAEFLLTYKNKKNLK